MLPSLLLVPALFAAMHPVPPVAPCVPFEQGQPPATATPAPLPAPPTLHRVPAPLAAAETARYRLTYGVLSVGEASVAVDGAATVRDRAPLHARGHATGSFVGFGRFDEAIDVAFDPVALVPVAPAPTAAPGRPQSWPRMLSRFQAPALPGMGTLMFDPVSLLCRVRADAPAPSTPLVATVFDGKGRWRVTVTNGGAATLPGTGPQAVTPALRLVGRAEPLSSHPEKDSRVARSFTLWLSTDPTHLPLRLEMPVGMATFTVALVEVRRADPADDARAAK
jgi:hypothetical protein